MPFVCHGSPANSLTIAGDERLSHRYLDPYDIIFEITYFIIDQIATISITI